MRLVPALFTLLGERSWYMTRWLERMLPNLTIEPPQQATETLNSVGSKLPAEPAPRAGERPAEVGSPA
jgi:RND superfamily putative drug exporter